MDKLEEAADRCRHDQQKTGILASVSMAQFLLESAYGKSELAQQANNCFGMKQSLSGNSWPGSAWDGKSIYAKQTKEQNADGSNKTITANFRKYASIEASIADHSAYLAGAKNGNALRYAGLVGETDYRKAAQIIKDGGYATSLTYVDKLCRVIEAWKLTQYDYKGTAPASTSTGTLPYLVQVTADRLNVRKGPGTRYDINIAYRVDVIAISPIVEEQNGWGRLKSGAGWISLAYTKRK